MKFRYTLLLLDSNLILPSPSLAFLPLQSTSLHLNPTPSPQTLLKVLPVISNKIFKHIFFPQTFQFTHKTFISNMEQ